jgi:hypothetical protein
MAIFWNSYDKHPSVNQLHGYVLYVWDLGAAHCSMNGRSWMVHIKAFCRISSLQRAQETAQMEIMRTAKMKF